MRLMMRFSLAGVAAALLALPTPARSADAAPLRAEGSEWVLQTATGTLRSADLVGAQLQLAGGAVLRIDSARLTSDGTGPGWWAHEVSVRPPTSMPTAGPARPEGQDGWQPLCAGHSDGSHYAVVLPGREQADGTLGADDSSFAVSCTSGALAKCLRMGYRPWQTLNGVPMRTVFNGCIRMVRADYGGQGLPHTENGRRIDVYDTLAVQSPDLLSGQAFEAGWNEQGAVCVHHLRIAGALALADLPARYPQLQGRVGAVCTEAFARAHGALLFNRSDDPTAR